MEAVDVTVEDLLPFDDLYRRYSPPVYRFCLSQVRNPSDAEDLAADVFAAAFVAYERTRPDPDGVLPWLLRIARNGAIDHHRAPSGAARGVPAVVPAQRTTRNLDGRRRA